MNLEFGGKWERKRERRDEICRVAKFTTAMKQEEMSEILVEFDNLMNGRVWPSLSSLLNLVVKQNIKYLVVQSLSSIRCLLNSRGNLVEKNDVN